MYVIIKEFHFEASHCLDGLPEGHQCARLHGHSYRVRLQLSAMKLNDDGFVQDYGELAWFADWLKKNLDHRDLNQVFAFWFKGEEKRVATTAENLASFIFGVVKAKHPLLESVWVSETSKTWAIYRPNPMRVWGLGLE